MSKLRCIGQGFPGEITPSIPFDGGILPTQSELKILVFHNLGLAPPEPTLTEIMTYWKQHVLSLVNKGGLVVVFLDQFELFYENENEFSENEETEELFKIPPLTDSFPEPTWNNIYEFLPQNCPPLSPKIGNDIQFRPHPLFSKLWEVITPFCHYTCTINGNVDFPLALSKTQKKLVSGLVKIGKGHVLLLPGINWEDPKLSNGFETFTPNGLKLSQFILAYIEKIHPHLHNLNTEMYK